MLALFVVRQKPYFVFVRKLLVQSERIGGGVGGAVGAVLLWGFCLVCVGFVSGLSSVPCSATQATGIAFLLTHKNA